MRTGSRSQESSSISVCWFQGNFSWGSEAITRKTRIIDVVYNAANNELVRTKTLVKNAIVVIDATPFRQWYEAHYALPLGHKKNTKMTAAEEELLNKKRSSKTDKKYKERQKESKVRNHAVFNFEYNFIIIVSFRLRLPLKINLPPVVFWPPSPQDLDSAVARMVTFSRAKSSNST